MGDAMTPAAKSPIHPRLLFWAAAAFAFTMAVIPHPPHVPGEPNDKIQHMVAFVTLAGLGAWAYRRTPLIRLAIGLSLFGAAIEVAQRIPALHRDAELLDWVADTVAAGAVLAAVRWWRSRG